MTSLSCSKFKALQKTDLVAKVTAPVESEQWDD